MNGHRPQKQRPVARNQHRPEPDRRGEDAVAPGVGSPEPDGLSAREAHLGLQRLAAVPGLRALEIVEYNPDRDRHGVTARLIAELIDAVLPQLTRLPRPSAPAYS